MLKRQGTKRDNKMRKDWKAIAESIGITAVVASLVFVGYEIRQNTSQLRTDGARSITEMVNVLNVSIFSDARLTEIVEKGIQNFESLDEIERAQFESFQFARLNIADYIMDLEREGISDLSFRYVDFIVRDFNNKPGLQAFIRAHAETYVGSPVLLSRLLNDQE
jgi:hypothetical protein